MKNTLPFFSHDNNASQHPKMKALIAEYGFEGYGRFWVLNEKIASTKGAYIDLSRKVYKLDLARDLGLNNKELDEFLSFLSDPEIDLINISENKVTTDRITELYEKTMENREYERNRKAEKPGKKEIPFGNGDFPDGKEPFPGVLPAENDTDKTIQENTKTIQEKTKQESGVPEEQTQSEKDSLELSELLLTSHRNEIPDYLSGKDDKKTVERWARDIEMLIRIDKKPPETIRRVILWAKTPGKFWFPNIQSGKKLREKYETLYSQMLGERHGTGPPPNRQEKKSL